MSKSKKQFDYILAFFAPKVANSHFGFHLVFRLNANAHAVYRVLDLFELLPLRGFYWMDGQRNIFKDGDEAGIDAANFKDTHEVTIIYDNGKSM